MASSIQIADALKKSTCPKFSEFHELLPALDRQLKNENILSTRSGPLKGPKTGYGFDLKEQHFLNLKCKANTLYYTRKIVVNCSKTTVSKAQSQILYDNYFDCFIDQGWGQRSIYLIDPSNDITQAKLYVFENSFSVEFIQFK